MNPILKTGLLIGVLCGIWMFVMGFTGWYRDPRTANLFFLVIPIESGGLYWGLRQTAAQGRPYGVQIIAGTFMAVVAGVIIIVSSLLFTMVAFPDYFNELEAGQRQILAAEGKSATDIETAVLAFRTSATPMEHAMSGFSGTLVTGIVATAVISIFTRASPVRRS
jgi:hypothetical protein